MVKESTVTDGELEWRKVFTTESKRVVFSITTPKVVWIVIEYLVK